MLDGLRTELDAVNPVKKKLDANMKKCAELIVMKDINKMTMDDIAEACGVNKSTIYRWKQRKDFNDFMNDLADEFHRSFLSEAYSELRKVLTYGKNHEKLKAIELMLKGQGKLKDVQETKTTIETEVNVDEILKGLGID